MVRRRRLGCRCAATTLADATPPHLRRASSSRRCHAAPSSTESPRHAAHQRRRHAALPSAAAQARHHAAAPLLPNPHCASASPCANVAIAKPPAATTLVPHAAPAGIQCPRAARKFRAASNHWDAAPFIFAIAP
ncbi:hypothetical protein GUJ93_ZPchr0534g2773 [Zizania palustris]|uniref:Uncharacterized protein n=1 Tax=Zizania palustris TaxID=103762 RepID=A0A8J5RAJ3_ZIZPA|nr:hypothetical protein GUJ93_ZPchr0534g2773 [Zizania palustris]